MSSGSPPLPLLPLEVKGDILRFCDQQTLARTARASLALFELAIPLLHDEIHIHGFDKLEKLFCSRIGSPPSALDDLLSLRRVRAFTLISTEKEGDYPAISEGRLVSGRALSVRHLTLGLYAPSDDERSPPPEDSDEEDDGVDPRWPITLALFSPELAVFRATSLPHGSELTYSYISLFATSWYRLQRIEFDPNTSSSHMLGLADFFRSRTPGPEAEQLPLTVVLRLTTPFSMSIKAQDLAVAGPGVDMFEQCSRLRQVVIRVDRETSKRQFLSLLERHWDHELTAADKRTRLGMIKIEVTGSTSGGDATG